MEMANQNGVVQVPNIPANLLQRFFITSNHFCCRSPENGDEREREEAGDAIELTLGLSLNGRFGTDPRSKKRKNNELHRSSSITEGFAVGETPLPVVRSVSDMFQVSRTRSLPVDTAEEEERRRKELQSRRRTEAKRKRSEKTRAFRESHTPREETGNTGGGIYGIAPGRVCGNDGGEPQGLDRNDRSTPGVVGGDARGRKGNVQSSGGSSGAGEREEEKREKNLKDWGRERARNVLENMPSVATREVGADGKRVEGFLYWMGKREDVRILCVCHGLLLSPAEFVSHGGAAHGRDLLNPLRHIVLTPPSSF